jgi:hypothetical protein
MTTLVIVALLVGVIFGLRLKWPILVPGVAVLLVSVAGFAIMRRSGVEWAMLAMVFAATALQVGYLCGAIARSVIAAASSNAAKLNREMGALNKRTGGNVGSGERVYWRDI